MEKIFPSSMKNHNEDECTPESVAMKLSYFQDQIHLIHWQTTKYVEHMALGSLYDCIFTFKDDVMEKIMGYTGNRPKGFIPKPLLDNVDASSVVRDLISYANKMETWAKEKKYSDIEGMAQTLSGKGAKTLYLLTLN